MTKVLPPVWLVGDWQQAEFREARAWLSSKAACLFLATANDALTTAVQDEPRIAPSAIVIAQSRPGQITSQDVERLHTAAPLARLIGLLGPWCEGEGRTGRPWPGVMRVPWRSWQAPLPYVLELATETAKTGWLPRTATEWERILWRGQDSRDLRFRGNAEIHTDSLASFHAWQDLLVRVGLKTDWICRGASASLNAEIAFFIGWESVPAGTAAGERPNSPARVLILDWPRPQDAQRAKSLGFCAVLAQPLLIGDLVATLDGVLPRRAVGRESAA